MNMRSIAVSLCICALAACGASNKASERGPIENPNEPDDPMSAESVRRNGPPSPDSDLDGHRDDGQRANRGLADDPRKAQDEGSEVEVDEPVAADNTGVNERDEAPSAIMPTDQGESDKDLEVTQKIRKAVMDDDSLSFTAKNVKIITQDGKVTLRGPVKSAQERSAIGAAAKQVAPGAVDNQLEVAN
jgi:hypothetical protein